MIKSHIVLSVLVAVLVMATLGVGGWFVWNTIEDQNNEPAPECTIVIPDSIEIFSDRGITLFPELLDAQGNLAKAKFEYSVNNTDAVSIDKKTGEIKILKPFSGTVEVTITEKNTGTVKKINVKVIEEVSGVLEIVDSNAKALSSHSNLVLEIGESYTYKAVTLPSTADIESFLQLKTTDAAGNEKRVFDVEVNGSEITLTVVGLGEGTLSISIKNDNRNLHYAVDVPFRAVLPDAALTQAVMEASGEELLSSDELGTVKRVVLGEDIREVSFEKTSLLVGLKTVVFTTDQVVRSDVSLAKPGLVYRVFGENLYLQYCNDSVWSSLKANIYPYISDYNKPAVVYHNEASLLLNGSVWNGETVVHYDHKTVTYESPDSPKLRIDEIDSQLTVVTYSLTGYTFKGWKDAGGATFSDEDLDKVYEGIHVYAQWQANTYTLVLDALYADSTENPTLSVVYNACIGTLPAPVKGGWEFAGWYADADYTVPITADTVFVQDADAKIYAKYTSVLLLDFLDIGNGNYDQTIPIVYGKAPGDALTAVPTDLAEKLSALGWSFIADGWSVSEKYEVSEQRYNAATPYLREGEGMCHVLHAMYTRPLSFQTMALAEAVDSVDLIYGLTLNESMAAFGKGSLSSVAVTPKQEYAAWRFIGWTAQSFEPINGNPRVFSDTELLTGAEKPNASVKTLYAVYASEVTYAFGPVSRGSGAKTERIIYKSAFSLPTVSEQYDANDAVNGYAGFAFVAWYFGAQEAYDVFSGVRVTVESDFAQRVYTAKYNAVPFEVFFKSKDGTLLGGEAYTGQVYYAVNADATDNVLNNDSEDFAGRKIFIPSPPEKKVYVGIWQYVIGDCTSALVYENNEDYWEVPVGVIGPAEFTAAYYAHSYAVTFDTHGIGSLAPTTVTYDGNYVLPDSSVTPDGYSFEGWYLDSDYTVYVPQNGKWEIPYSENGTEIVLYAKFTVSVSFEGITSDSVEWKTFVYGGQAVFDPLPATAGWSFVGWRDAKGNLYTENTYSDYRSNNKKYVSVWERRIALAPGEGFTTSDAFITVVRGSTLAESGAVLPKDEDVRKAADNERWTIARWYYQDGDERKYVDENSTLDDPTVGTLYAEAVSEVTLTVAFRSEYKQYTVTVVLGMDCLTGLDAVYADDLQAFQSIGYYHRGWRIGEEEYLIGSYGVVALSYGGQELTAIFDGAQYTVLLDTAGGNLPTADAEMLLIYGEEKTLPTPTRVGYNFIGWKFADTVYGKGEKISNLTVLDGDSFTLEALWTEIEYNIEYSDENGETFTFDVADESNIPFFNMYGNEIVLPYAKKVGHLFIGWEYCGVIYTAGEPVNIPVIAGENAEAVRVSLVAKWRPILYNVEFESNGGYEVDPLTALEYQQSNVELPKTERAWYEFVGWYTDPGFTSEPVTHAYNLASEDGVTVKLYARWQLNTHEIRYLDEHGAPVGEPVEFNIESVAYYQPPVPVKAGYVGYWDFSAMPTSPSDEEKTEYIVKACYTAITYKISFLDFYGNIIVDGGVRYEWNYSVEQRDILDSVRYKEALDEIPGYRFVGWSVSKAEFLAKTSDIRSGDAAPENIIVQAQYEANRYTVVFMDGASEKGRVENFTVNDASISMPEAPTRKGYISRWRISREIIEQKIFALGTENTVIVIESEYIPITYKITVDTGNGVYEYPYTAQIIEDGKIGIVAPTLPEGYTFASADDISVVGNEIFITAPSEYRDVFIYTVKAGSCTVIFDYAVGKTTAVTEVTNKLTAPTPERVGFTLEGWYDNADCLGERVDFNTLAPADGVLHLYARWVENCYEITLDANGGTLPLGAEESRVYAYEETLQLPVPYREGYTFLGWKTESGTSVDNTSSRLVAENGGEMRLVAAWRGISYNVTFDPNGGSGTALNIAATFGREFTLPYGLYKKGYLLSGWSYNGVTYSGTTATDLATESGATVTLVAVWTPIQYTVIFENAELDDRVFTYDADATFPQPPERNGLEFKNWSVNGSKYQAGDLLQNLTDENGAYVIVSANWTTKKLTLKLFESAGNSGYLTRITTDQLIGIWNELDPYSIDLDIPDGALAGWTVPNLVDPMTGEYQTYLVTGSKEDFYSVVYVYVTEAGEAFYSYRILEKQNSGFATIAPILPERLGYNAEWKYSAPDADGRITATVSYTLKNTDVYTVTFDTGYKGILKQESAAFADVLALPTLTRIGYNFKGWAVLGGAEVYADGGKSFTNAENLASVTLVAQWEPKQYTVSFAGTDLYYTYTVEDHSSIPETISEAIPVRVGYVGQWIIPHLTTGDITVYPTYVPITYTVELDLAGGVGSFPTELSVSYGTYAAFGSPTRSGYRFLGYKYGDKLYAADSCELMTLTATESEVVTLVAQWSNSYSATFMADGEVYDVLAFDDSDIGAGKYIIPEKLLSDKVYHFVFWSDLAITDGADVVITLEQIEKMFAIRYYTDAEREELVATVYYTDTLYPDVQPKHREKAGYSAVWEAVRFEEDGSGYVIAVYSSNTYNVLFDANGGTCVTDSKSVTHHGLYGMLPIPFREGYDFVEWQVGGVAICAESTVFEGGDHVATAIWSEKEYTITLVTNGGLLADGVSATVGVRFKNGYGALPIPTKAGYTFAGWYYNGHKIEAETTLDVPYDHSLTAKWEAIRYLVYYEDVVKEWTVETDIEFFAVYPGDEYIWVTETGEGYTLAVNSFALNPVSGRYELHLIRKNVPTETDNIIVTFIVADRFGNESVIAMLSIAQDGEFLMPSLPYKAGSVGRWDYSAYVSALIELGEGRFKLDEAVIREADLPDNNIKIYAEYSNASYTVSFDSDGGSYCNDITVSYATAYGTLPTPTRIGYSFAGWYLGNTDTAVTAADKVTQIGDHILMARWTENTYTVQYVVDNQFVVESATYWYTELFSIDSSLGVKDDYRLVGWKIDGGDETVYSVGASLSMLSGSHGATITFVPVYEAVEYTLTFEDENGNTVGTVTYTVSDNGIVAPDVPVKEHYEGRWVIPALDGGDKVATVAYTPKEYILTYTYDGGTKSVSYTAEDTSLVVPPAHEKRGYAVRWQTFEIGMTELTAIYTPIVYTVTFYSSPEKTSVVWTTTYTVLNKEITSPPVVNGYSAWAIPALDIGDVDVVPVNNAITVRFYDDAGNIISTVSPNSEGMLAAIPQVPAKEGYSAVWSTDVSGVITEDVNVYPVYNLVIGYIDFYNENGVLVEQVPYTILDKTVDAPPIPFKQYYVGEWRIPERTYDGTRLAASPVYTPIVYTVTFKALLDPTEIGFGYEYIRRVFTVEDLYVEIPPVPDRSSYGFDIEIASWDADQYAEFLHAIEVLELRDFEIEARYTGYYIHIDGNEGEVQQEKIRVETSGFITPGDECVKRTGYTLIGWTYVKDGKQYDLNQSVTENLSLNDAHVVLRAVWKVNSYTVLFDPGPGTASFTSSTVTFDAMYGRLPSANLWGYTFGGWYLGDTEITEGTIVQTAADHTLHAKWLANPWTVSFDPGLGTVSFSEKSVVYDQTYGNLPVATRVGHTFAGWYYGNTEIKEASLVHVNGDHTLSAKWTPCTYTLFYQSKPFNEVTYGLPYGTLPDAPTKTGHIFGGWQIVGTNTIITSGSNVTYAGDHEIEPLWTPREYTVKISSTGEAGGSVSGVYNGQKIPYGRSVTITASYNGDEDKWMKLNGTKVSNSYTFTVTGDMNIEVHSDNSCIAAGSMITLADGTRKKVEELSDTDHLLVYDHENGAFVSAPILFVERDGWKEYHVIYLVFSNGQTTRIIDEHAFFDLDLNKYVYIDRSSYSEYVGHSFAVYNEATDSIEQRILEDAYIQVEYTGCYSLITQYHMNYFVDGLFSLPGGIDGMFNIFEYGENLAYDSEKMQADIEEYGLYTYEDFAEYVPYELFEGMFPAKYFKVAVGKGLITYEEILARIEKYLVKHGLA